MPHVENMKYLQLESRNQSHSCHSAGHIFFIGIWLLYLLCQILLYSKVIHIHISPLLWSPFPFSSPQTMSRASCAIYTVGSHELCILNRVGYTYQSQSSSFSQPSFPPWYPYVCSLHLCL